MEGGTFYDVQQLPRYLATDARRRLLLEIRRVGVSAEDIAHWSMVGWWPTLRDEVCFLRMRRTLEAKLGLPDPQWAETQIVVRLPDEDEVAMGPPHVDTLPGWAVRKNLGYDRIYSVELTDTSPRGGSIVLHPPHVEPFEVRLRAGEVLSMPPDMPHSGSPNLSADIRMAAIFRLLKRLP